MSEMIDRAVRAMKTADTIWAARKYPQMPQAEIERLVAEAGSEMGYEELARAAIEALRGPSNDMTVTGWKIAGERDAVLGNGEIAMIWDAMIDTALGPTP